MRHLTLSVLIAGLLLAAASPGLEADPESAAWNQAAVPGLVDTGYLVFDPEDSVSELVVGFGGPWVDPAHTMRALVNQVDGAATQVVVPYQAFELRTGFQARPGPASEGEATQIARILGGRVLDHVAGAHHRGAPLSLYGCWQGAQTVLELLLDRRHLEVERLVLIAPDPAQLPFLSEELPIERIEVFLAGRSAADLEEQRATLAERLAPVAERVRLFQGVLPGRTLNDLLQEMTWVKEGFRIVDARTGDELTLRQLAERVLQARVSFFGEEHDSTVTHRLQRELLLEMLRLEEELAVGFEMFERDVQGPLDEYLEGSIPEAEFLSASRPWPNYRTDYRPVLELAREHQLPVLAANVPRRLARAVARGGVEALEEVATEEQPWMAQQLLVLEDPYQERFFEVMQQMGGGHGSHGMSTETLARVYAAQCLKDDTMAESIHRHLQEADPAHVYFLNGAFHSDFGLGVPQKLALLQDGVSTALIRGIPCTNPRLATLADVEPDIADYVIFVAGDGARLTGE